MGTGVPGPLPRAPLATNGLINLRTPDGWQSQEPLSDPTELWRQRKPFSLSRWIMVRPA